MNRITRELLAMSLATGVILSPLWAQDRSPTAPPAASPASAPRILTGKERLGPKWTDEQRIDNCNVPLDRRGTRPRPDACENIPSN
jgi:hypothetical protein